MPFNTENSVVIIHAPLADALPDTAKLISGSQRLRRASSTDISLEPHQDAERLTLNQRPKEAATNKMSGLPPLAPALLQSTSSPLTSFLTHSPSLGSISSMGPGQRASSPTSPYHFRPADLRSVASESNASMSCGNLSYSGLFHRRPRSTYCRSLATRQRHLSSGEQYIQPPSPHLDLPLTPRKSAVSSAFVVALAIVLIVCYLPRRFAVPSHLLEQPVQVEGSYLSTAEASSLRGFIRNGGPIHTRKGHVADVAFSTAEEDQCCDDSVQSVCQCQLRTDVSHHYYRTGGPDGLKESALSLWRRAQTFQIVLPSPEAMDGCGAIKHVANKKRTKALLASTCHADAQQVTYATIDILLPGQVMPVEIGVPPNTSANQSFLPPWLQGTMMFSGRFGSDVLPPVAEITTFFHSGRDKEGGAVRLWQGHDGVALDVSPTPLAAIAMDSSRVVHTRGTLHSPGSVPPPLPPNKQLALHFDPSTQRWVVTADGSEVVATYKEEALRLSLTMVAKCGGQVVSSHSQDASEVLDTLKQELLRRKVGTIESDPRALQRQLTRTLVRYPLPPTDVPYNYCWQLEHLGDWARPFTRLFCD